MMPPPMPQRLCAPCLMARAQWDAAHRADIETMIAAVREAVQAGKPLEVQDPSELLPENLRPGQPGGMPAVQPSVTTLNGTDLCPGHMPGAQGARPSLFIANGPLNPAALAQLAGAPL
jgi:hypothetical protein